MLLLLSLNLTGCGGDGPEDKVKAEYAAKDADEEYRTAEPASMPTGEVPSIKIVAPKAGEALSGQAIRVGVVVRGLVMDPEAIGKAKAPGRGHWHLYLDGAFVNATAVDQTTLETLPPGPHHLRVSLANNDHSSLSPPVEDNVVIDVR